MAYEECTVVGRNAVMEAYRSGKTIDKLFILDGCQDGPIKSILREARKRDTLIKFVSKEKLDSLSFHEKHQGVVAIAAAYEYATVEDLFKKAEEKGEAQGPLGSRAFAGSEVLKETKDAHYYITGKENECQYRCIPLPGTPGFS